MWSFHRGMGVETVWAVMKRGGAYALATSIRPEGRHAAFRSVKKITLL